MPSIYDRANVRFLYPENWKLVEEDRGSEPQTVSLQSPSGGIWSLMLYAGRPDGLALADEIVSAMKSEYEEVEVTPHSESLETFEASGYEMCFHCLDFLVSARALVIQRDRDAVLLLWQAEDREFAELLPVFRAITTSFLAPRDVPDLQ
jgi:hypothetical protein